MTAKHVDVLPLSLIDKPNWNLTKMDNQKRKLTNNDESAVKKKRKGDNTGNEI